MVCASFLKEYMCKHVIGMALGFKLGKEEGDCPWAACALKCDQVRGVGRPVNAKKALIRKAQPEPVRLITIKFSWLWNQSSSSSGSSSNESNKDGRIFLP